MNCTEFDRHWQRRLDIGAGVTPASMESHLQVCARCQAWHQAWQTLERSLESWPAVGDHEPTVGTRATSPDSDRPAEHARPVPQLTRDFTVATPDDNRIGTQIHKSRATEKTRSSGWLARLAASALMVLVSAGLAWQGSARWSRYEISSSPSIRPKGPATDTVRDQTPNLSAATPVRLLALSQTPTVAGDNTVPRGSLRIESNPAQPGMVKPLVGVVHNMTSLVLPGWPSAWNDSVGIPHYIESTAPQTLVGQMMGESDHSQPDWVSALPNPEMPLPEPVEELLAVATESVQTMWQLARDW